MPQTTIFKINDKIVKELFCDGICKYVTIIKLGKLVQVPDDGIVTSGIVCRLAPGFLFYHFADEVRKEYSFKGFRLPEVVYVVLSWLCLKDRT